MQVELALSGQELQKSASLWTRLFHPPGKRAVLTFIRARQVPSLLKQACSLQLSQVPNLLFLLPSILFLRLHKQFARTRRFALSYAQLMSPSQQYPQVFTSTGEFFLYPPNPI
jgi:hypothetical protein